MTVSAWVVDFDEIIVKSLPNYSDARFYHEMYFSRKHKYRQYSLPDCYKKWHKKCNSPGIFPVLVVFFREWVMYYSSDSRTVTKKMSRKCNSPGIFPALVLFLGVFFRKFAKKSHKNPKI